MEVRRASRGGRGQQRRTENSWCSFSAFALLMSFALSPLFFSSGEGEGEER